MGLVDLLSCSLSICRSIPVRTRLTFFASGALLSFSLIWYLYDHFHNVRDLVDNPQESTIIRNFRTPVLKMAYGNMPRIDLLNRIKRETGASLEIEKRTVKLMGDPLNYDKLGRLVVSGRKSVVEHAERLLAQRLGELVVFRTPLHQSYIRHIRGKQGRRLNELKLSTGALIRIGTIPASKYLPLPTGKENEHVLYVVGTSIEVNRTKSEIDDIIYNQKWVDPDFKAFSASVKKPKTSFVDSSPPKCVEPLFDATGEWLALTESHPTVDFASLVNKDGFICVWLPSFSDPNLFWIQPYTLEPIHIQLDDLSDSIVCDPENEIKEHTLVAAPLEDSGIFVRAFVLALSQDDKSKVFLVDRGGIHVVATSSLRHLTVEHQTVEWRAAPCSLSDAKPLKMTWCKRALSSFAELANVGITVPSKIRITKIFDSDVLQVDLIVQANDNTEINVAEHLIANNLAIRSYQVPQKTLLPLSTVNNKGFCKPNVKVRNRR